MEIMKKVFYNMLAAGLAIGFILGVAAAESLIEHLSQDSV